MWRPGALAREAFRNLGPRHGVLTLAMGVVLAIVGVATVASASSALGQQAGERNRGADVWWVEADADGEPVPARVCATLNGQPGVVGAGAVGREQVEWRAFPAARGVTVDVVTPGVWAAWGAPALTGGAVAGSDLVDIGLVGVGTVLYDDGGSAHRVTARTPESVRPARLRANVSVVRPADFRMGECWVRMDPGALEAGRDLVEFMFEGYGVTITQFAVDDSALLSPREQWLRFAGLAPGLVAGALIGMLLLLTHWGRRAEFAVYRAFGSAIVELMFLVLVELALVLAPAVIAAAAASTAALAVAVAQAAVPSTGIAEVARAALSVVASAAVTGWALGVVTLPIALRGGLHEQLKDR